jgi:rubredoxin
MSEQNEVQYVCVVCGHTLSEADWLSLPDEVNCPECGVNKNDYVRME